MANIPCPNIIDCPGSDSPIENYSAEAPDHFYFVRNWPVDGKYIPPPIPPQDNFIAYDCNGLAFSVESQEIADLIAQINLQNCTHPVGPVDPTDPKDPRYCNAPQTATKTCANGTVLTYHVDAALFCMSTQSAADAYALAYAQQQVARMTCPELRCNISTNASLPDGTVASAYSTQVVGSLPTGAHWYVATGTLPPGLTLNVHTGYITGTPTTSGTYHFTIGTRYP